MRFWKRKDLPDWSSTVEMWAITSEMAIALYSDGRVWVGKDQIHNRALAKQLSGDRQWEEVVQ